MLIASLSLPAIVAQITSVIMQYIDASMVGQLGAQNSAAIGLISTTTWLIGGLCGAVTAGFTVQVAHRIGAGEEREARGIMRHGLLFAFGFSCFLCALCLSISEWLPRFLGGEEAILGRAAAYFRIYALGLLAMQMVNTAGGMLQSSGNMRVPSTVNILQCCLNVFFNALFIFESGERTLMGITFSMPGAGLGVKGAALGTAVSQAVCALIMLSYLLFRSAPLHLRRGERDPFSGQELRTVLRIALPVGGENAIMGFAYVMSTRIVSPLGSVALAANSFSVTAESLCYMPGFGISAAAVTLVGQSIGAGRTDLTKRLGWLCTFIGMAVMAVIGMLMYLFSPQMIGMLSPDPEIRALGTQVLRIEAFAEPMFAASIIASGVFRGAGNTLIPSLINLFSMWAVRLTLAALLAPRLGLRGVWLAMCIELCVRGALYLVILAKKKL
ncbi:MAG: MATE family efflux transporter [Parasporobacterium sp.]|nr:MATE family efflux transporter [Parasporobacterium sp.]